MVLCIECLYNAIYMCPPESLGPQKAPQWVIYLSFMKREWQLSCGGQLVRMFKCSTRGRGHLRQSDVCSRVPGVFVKCVRYRRERDLSN